MTREEELNRASMGYREFRKQCGVKSPILLDEVEEAFYVGGGWADKTMLEKVIEWLDNNLCCYIGAQNFTIEHDRLNKDLRKDMGL